MDKMLYIAFLGVMTGGLAVRLWYSHHRSARIQELEEENRLLRQEKGWLSVGLAAQGVEVPQYLAEARRRAEFIPMSSEDYHFSRFWKYAVLFGTMAAPALTLAK